MLALCSANATYLAGLESALGADGACLVAGTGAPLVQMMRRQGIVATSIDEDLYLLGNIDGALSSGVVIGAAPIVQLLEEQRCDAVLPFKSGSRLWQMAEWQGLQVLAADHKLTRQLENKLALAEIAAAAEAQIPDTVTVRLDEQLAAAAREDGLALPRVYQPAVGFAGAGTVHLRTSRDVEALVEHPPGGVRVGKLVEFVDGSPVTVNGVVIPPGMHGSGEQGAVLVGMVARQLTGIRGMTPTDLGSCGNDWTQPPAHGDVASVRLLAARIGEVLAARGFAGAFGIDAMLPASGGVPVLIEINPRWTASLALQVELQELGGMPTLLDAHLAAFGYRPEERASLDELLQAYEPGDGATCTRLQHEASTVIAYNSTGRDVVVRADLEPGVWRDAGADGLQRVRDGWRCADLRSKDEFLILSAGNVRPVPHGSYLLRVVRLGPAAATPRADELLADVQQLMERVVARAIQ